MMKTSLKLSFAILLSALSFSASATLPTSLLSEQANVPAMLKKITPAIVNLSVQGEFSMMVDPNMITSKDSPAAPQPDDSIGEPAPNGLLPIKRGFSSLGSGVIADAKNGYVITNAHVVKDAKTITVTLTDGRKFLAKIIGADSQSDIAVLQIKPDKLSAIVFGDSDDIKVGQPVVAIGNPFGIGQTVTSGIVSGLGRSNLHIENFEDFIQTDASINPGNSGGALVNLRGEMIGVNTAILAPNGGNIGIGFAIPSNMAHSVMMQLIKYGAIHRGLMGVIVNDLTPDLANSFNVPENSGAVIAMVTPNSPAFKAGLKIGDIITEINGIDITNAAKVRNYVGLQQVGTHLIVNVLRAGKKMTFNIITADPDAYEAQIENDNPFLFGLDLQDFDAQTLAAGRIKGVLIVHAKPESAAWRSGLRDGDVILSVNRETVGNIDQLLAAAKKDPNQMLLNIYRINPGAASFVVVK